MTDETSLTVATGKGNASSSIKNGGGGVPSGFVLKLYQMVNGAPDEVISWLPSGDAFRISDLSRLESETLPTFFRHKRFQSLVRQLNFYNFRKVNRERTFWVYRHPLFHRDRPSELHLLRRRTCPGVDGRKHRPELDINCLARQVGFLRENGREDSSDGSQASVRDDNMQTKRRLAEDIDSKKRAKLEQAQKQIKPNTDLLCDSSVSRDPMDSTINFDGSAKSDETFPVASKSRVLRSFLVKDDQEHSVVQPITSSVHEYHGSLEEVSLESRGDGFSQKEGNLLRVEEDKDVSDKKSRSERMEQSLLVSKVTRQLEAHAKRAAAVAALHDPRKGGRRRAGTVTPPFAGTNDTMKYHALTYDDEMEIYESDKDSEAITIRSKKVNSAAIVTDEYDSEDSRSTNSKEVTANSMPSTHFGNCVSSDAGKIMKSFMTPPVEDTNLISEVVRKLHNWVGIIGFASNDDGQLAAAIAGFCMSTAPQDPLLREKALKLMNACGTLAQEFRRYKAALLPSCASAGFFSKIDPQNESIIKQIFQGDHNGKDTVRIFRVFLLNSLDDLVRDSNLVNDVHLSRIEAATLHECVKVWFAGVKASA